MASVIVDGIGPVTPEDPNFFNLPQDVQAQQIDELVATAKKAGIYQGPVSPSKDGQLNEYSYVNQGPEPDTLKTRGSILPIGKTQSGETVLALPQPLELARKTIRDLMEGTRSADQITGQEIFNLGSLLGLPSGGARQPIATAAENIGPKLAAQKEVTRAIARDQMTPTSIQEAASASPRSDMATLADVGGTNVKGLSERVAQTPGGARANAESFLTDRQKTQLSRVSGDLKDLTGTNKTAMQSISENIAKRSTDAAPAYNAAYDAGDRVIINDELRRLSAVPEVQTAMKQAIAGWQRDQIASGYGAMKPGINVSETKTIDGVETGAFPTVEVSGGRVPVTPNLQFWDYTKGALDSMIESAIKPDGTMTRQGRALTIIKNKMLDTLDKEVPEYANARATWGGPSEYIAAIRDGKGFRGISAEEVSAKLNGFKSDAQREAYRIGALSDIFTKMGNKPNALADITTELRSPEMRGKISALMPTAQSAAKWDRILNFETNSSQLVGRSLAGSPTARRQLESIDSGNLVGDLVMDAFMGSAAAGLFKKFIVGTGKAVRDRLMAQKDQEIANLLYNPKALGTLGHPVQKFSGSAVSPFGNKFGKSLIP